MKGDGNSYLIVYLVGQVISNKFVLHVVHSKMLCVKNILVFRNVVAEAAT